MSEGTLSQDEIDALLSGEAFEEEKPAEVSEAAAAPSTGAPSPAPAAAPPVAVDANKISKQLGDSMSAAGSVLTTILNKKVTIVSPTAEETTYPSLKEGYKETMVCIRVPFAEGPAGEMGFILTEKDASIIADLMMGGDGTNPQQKLDDLYMSAVTEAVNQMIGASLTQISSKTGQSIQAGNLDIKSVDFSTSDADFSFKDDPKIMKYSYKFSIEGLSDGTLDQILPVNVAADLQGRFGVSASAQAPSAGGIAPAMPATQPQPSPGQVTPMAAQPAFSQVPPPQMMPGMVPGMAPGIMPQSLPGPPVNVQSVQFPSFAPQQMQQIPSNINILLDVPMELTVELGRTKKMIKEVLELGPGSVVELDKLAGEAVDILVNGKLIAKGEVVVIEENFGVRVTDIISPMERLANLQ